MNQEQFFRTLRRMLKKLPEDELERILAYYREIIEDEVENGKTEEEAIGGLGNIHTLVQKILAENPNRRKKDAGKIVAIVLLSFLGVVLVASLVLSAFSIRWYFGENGLQFTKATVYRVDSGDSVGGYIYKTYQTKPDGVTRIDLSAENKAVVFEPSDAGQITVDYAANDGENYDFSCVGGTLTIRNETREHTWNHLWNTQNAPTITVHIPKAYAGDIKTVTSNSYIRITDFKNLKVLNLETTNSYIKASSLNTQAFQVKTENGAIDLDSITASSHMSAETENAAIQMAGIDSPDISLETENAMISGTIRGREEDYTIDAETTNAISNLHSRSGGSKKLSVRTTNAIISVKFQG